MIGSIGYVYLAIGILVVLLEVAVGLYVCRDAKRRGMNAALWTAMAVLVPCLLGVIAYILRRGSVPEGKLCVKCGTRLMDEYRVCPVCGSELVSACPGCGKEISPEWRLCPFCALEQKQPRQIYRATGKTDIALIAAIIILALLVFVVLFTFLLMPLYGVNIAFSSFNRTIS